MERAAEDADPTGGMLDDSQNVDLRAIQEIGGEEVGGDDPFAPGIAGSSPRSPSRVVARARRRRS
jgi:hypothetical protein